MTFLFRPRTLLRLAFALALVLALAFALRLGVSVIYWGANQSRPIEPWMPVGYVARSWDVPREALAEALDLEPGALPHASIQRIASQRNEPVADVIARLEAAVAAHRAEAK